MTNQGSAQVISHPPGNTLSGLFAERVRRSGQSIAYLQYCETLADWRSYTWDEVASEVYRWQVAFDNEGLHAGDRIAIQLKSGVKWVAIEQAALASGLIVVPLYVNDRPKNTAYILRNTEAKILVLESAKQWNNLEAFDSLPKSLQRVVIISGDDVNGGKVVNVHGLLPVAAEARPPIKLDPDSIATIPFTSGSTAKAKGVMLSHANIISNTHACLEVISLSANDLFLSFLPISHMLERTAGHYAPMMSGARVAYARSIADLGEDMVRVQPTIIVAVPLVYEQIYTALQKKLRTRTTFIKKLFQHAVAVGYDYFLWRQKRQSLQLRFALMPIYYSLFQKKLLQQFGGHLNFAICGGARLEPDISRVFIGLGLNLLQGYGLTEASPVLTCNSASRNYPEYSGYPLPGVELKLSDQGEILARGPNIMAGYCQDSEATRIAFTEDGWLKTGDCAEKIGDYFNITGRLKDIYVMSNGENISPSAVESAISSLPYVKQCLLVGDQQQFLTAFLVINTQDWESFAESYGLHKLVEGKLNKKRQRKLCDILNLQLQTFPSHYKIKKVHIDTEPWSIDNKLLTPTHKVIRPNLLLHYQREIKAIYRISA